MGVLRGRRLWQQFTVRLWPLPVLGLVVALGLGIALPRVDAAVDDNLPPWLAAFLFSGGASAARAVLAAIATSLISVTSLTFSLTVVTLQLASSQYSPRLLRTFSSDRFVHATLALFLASFVYALTVLRTVRAPDETRGAFVPELSVTVSFLLTLASALGLVLFLSHLAREIRVESILRNVHHEADATAGRTLETRARDREGGTGTPWPGGRTWALMAPQSGFLTGVDRRQLVAVAVDADVAVDLEVSVGSNLVEGVPIGTVIDLGGASLQQEGIEELRERIASALQFGYERTAAQDVGFGLRQLTDVATKALSPGVNDPTTAVHALHHSAALLSTLSRFELDEHILCDETGVPRVRLRQPTFPELLDVALSQPRLYGTSDPTVVSAMFSLLRAVGWTVELTEHRAAVSAELSRLRAAVDTRTFDTPTLERFSLEAEGVVAALRRSDAD